jgi:hypothetical protein
MTYKTSIRFKEMPTSTSLFREKVNSLIKNMNEQVGNGIELLVQICL